MKTFEFVNNNFNMMLKIKELIFFEDNMWMFPQYNLKEYLEETLETKIPDYFFETPISFTFFQLLLLFFLIVFQSKYSI